jgi:1-deoxy-D-xylulose 5-phosphate reductoisomerase
MKKITISEFIANERIVRKKVIANHSNGEKRAIEDFSYVSFFLGKEYDEEISKIIKNNSDDLFVIDFLDSSIGITDIENIIKSAYNSKNER